MVHFTRALAAGRERPFVRALQVNSLLQFTAPAQIRVEIFQLAMDIRERDENLGRDLRRRLIESV